MSGHGHGHRHRHGQDGESWAERLARLDAVTAGHIATHGWSAVGVFPTETSPGPHFCYTVGLEQTWHHPELVVVGLHSDQAHRVLASAVEALRAGAEGRDGGVRAYRPGRRYPAVLAGGYEVGFRAVRPDDERMPMSMSRRLTPGCRALQLLWPDAANRLPTEPGFDAELVTVQVLLAAAPGGREDRARKRDAPR